MLLTDAFPKEVGLDPLTDIILKVETRISPATEVCKAGTPVATTSAILNCANSYLLVAGK